MIIYTSSSSFDPNTTIAPTWVRIEGKFLFGATNGSIIDTWTTSSTGDSYKVGTIGGEVTHQLTVAELAKHRHSYTHLMNGGSYHYFSGGGVGYTYPSYNTNYTGDDTPHNNMPPFKAVYIWERTA